MHPPPPPAEAFEADPVDALVERAFVEPTARRDVVSALRAEETPRAQLAAALLCFDLARSGDTLAQQELGLLAPAFELFDRGGTDVPALLADPRLETLWSEARETLGRSDPRDYAPVLPLDGAASEAVLPLFEGEETPVAGVVGDAAEEARLRAVELRKLVQRHLAVDLTRRVVRFGRNFRLASAEDVDRLEAFLRESDARAAIVPAAKGLACLGHLWLAAHLRRFTVVGALNERRAREARRGLAALDANLEALEEAAALFAFESEPAEGFQKVVELVLDFLRWCHREGRDPLAEATVEEYVALGRLPPAVLGGRERRRR